MMNITIDSLLREDDQYAELSTYFEKLTFADICSVWDNTTKKAMIELADAQHRLLMGIFINWKLIPKIMEYKEKETNVRKKYNFKTTSFDEMIKCEPEYKVLEQYLGGITIEDIENLSDNISGQIFVDMAEEQHKQIMEKFADNIAMPIINERAKTNLENIDNYFDGYESDISFYTNNLSGEKYKTMTNPGRDSISPATMSISTLDMYDNSDNDTALDVTDEEDLHGETLDAYIERLDAEEKDEVQTLINKCLKDNILDLGGRLKNIPIYDIFMRLRKIDCSNIRELNISRNNIQRAELVYIDYIICRLTNLKVLDMRGNKLDSFSACLRELRSIMKSKSIQIVDIRNNPMTDQCYMDLHFKLLDKKELWKLIWIPEEFIMDDYWTKSVKDDENIRNIVLKNHNARYNICKS